MSTAEAFLASRSKLLFGRRAALTVNTLELKDFRIAFSVKRDLKAIPNVCDVSVYNLNAAHRAMIEKSETATVKLEAGYRSGISRLFLGNLRTGWNEKQGVDWVTRLSSGDGEKAIQKARVSISVGPGAPVETTLLAIVRALGVGEGNVAQAAASLKLRGVGTIFAAGTVITGSAARELTDFCRSAGLEWSIQDGAVQILDVGKPLLSTAILLSPSTGLIGTPTVDKDGVVSAQTLMIPDLYPGRVVVFASTRVKGAYRVEQTTHAGDSHQGDWGISLQAKPF